MITRLEQKQLPIPHAVLHSTLKECAAAIQAVSFTGVMYKSRYSIKLSEMKNLKNCELLGIHSDLDGIRNEVDMV